MIQTVKSYQKLVDDIPSLLDQTHYKLQYVMSELGITKATFYRKLKLGTWTTDEVIKLLKFIAPKEYYKWEFEKELELAELDLKKGKLISNEKVMKDIDEHLNSTK